MLSAMSSLQRQNGKAREFASRARGHAAELIGAVAATLFGESPRACWAPKDLGAEDALG